MRKKNQGFLGDVLLTWKKMTRMKWVIPRADQPSEPAAKNPKLDKF